MKPATLAGVNGAGEVHSRRVSESRLEYRGVFAFRAEHTAEVVRLLDSGEVVEYEGPIGDENMRLQVVVTDVSIETGLAYFAGRGEPYSASQDRAAGE